MSQMKMYHCLTKIFVIVSYSPVYESDLYSIIACFDHHTSHILMTHSKFFNNNSIYCTYMFEKKKIHKSDRHH